MDKSQALHNFWSSFGWPAYDETTVPETGPDQAELPYITYMVILDAIDQPVYIEGSLWMRSTSWATISQKADEIAQYIGYGGKTVPIDGGYMWIQRGSPFAQRLSDDDDTIRRIMINLAVEFLTAV